MDRWRARAREQAITGATTGARSLRTLLPEYDPPNLLLSSELFSYEVTLVAEKDIGPEKDIGLLAREAVSGDAGSLNELIVELQPMVVRVTRLIVGPMSWAAEDAAQEALIDVARGIGSLKEPGSVRAWARKVAVSRALKVARHEKLRSLLPSRATERELAIRHANPEGGPGMTYSEELKRAFYRLPSKTRAIAVLRLHAGLSEAETAAAVGCSVGTVKSQLYQARMRLAQQLGTEG